MSSTNVGVDSEVFARQGFRDFLERELDDMRVPEDQIISLFGKLETQLGSMSKRKCSIVVSKLPPAGNKSYTDLTDFGSVSMYIFEDEDIFIYVPQ